MVLSLVLRDIQERGRNLEHVLSQYMNVVKPSFEDFILPVCVGCVCVCDCVYLCDIPIDQEIC